MFLLVGRMGVPTTWQGIPTQAQIQTTPQQIAAAPGTTIQQPGLVFPIQQYQVSAQYSASSMAKKALASLFLGFNGFESVREILLLFEVRVELNVCIAC